MIKQIGDTCFNLCSQIRATDRSRMHWRRNVLRLAAVARHELGILRSAARVPGVNRDGLLALIKQLEAELDRALNHNTKGGDRCGCANSSGHVDN